MIVYFLSVLLFLKQGRQISKKENTINVKTFYDYSVEIEKEHDVLVINVPERTYILISSIDGYYASVYNQKSEFFQSITPTPEHRLIFFKKSGSLHVTSTINSLKFKFSALPLDKLKPIGDENYYNYRLLVSTRPNETLISNYSDCFQDVYFDCELRLHLIWLVTDQNIDCEINGQAIYYISNENEDGDQIAPQNASYPMTINGKSKILILQTYSTIELKPEKNSIFDYYTNLKLYFDYTLDDIAIVKKGDQRISSCYAIGNLPNGLSYIDFTLAQDIDFHVRKNIIIFPLISSLKFDSNNGEEICGFVQDYTEKKTVNIFSDDSFKKEMNFPVLSFPLCESYVSMRPNEYVKIGSVFDESTNYSNDMNDFQYIMACLQDIETIVNFSGKVTFNCIFDNCTEKESIETGDTILGPFWAIVKKGATCEFITALKGEIKDGINDKFHSHILQTHKNQFLSGKFGLLRFFDAVDSKNKWRTDDGKCDAIEITAHNYVYINTHRYWRGEIIDPILPIEDREFGPHLNKRSFYISGVEKCKFVIYYELNVDLFFITQSISSDSYHCDKLMAFNHPFVSFNIKTEQEKNSIQLDINETLCIDANYMYPLFHYYINDFDNDTDIVSITGYNGKGWLYYENPKIVNDTLYINLYGILAIQSKNESMDLDLNFEQYHIRLDVRPFDIITNERWTGDYKFYSELTINNSYGIHYIQNKFNEREPEPEYYENDTFEIKKNGFKFINMNDIELLTIICPKYTLLYIHNIDDIEVDLYNTDDTMFGNITNKSKDRIITFRSGGKAVVKKTSKNVELFISYLVTSKYRTHVYVCSDPFFTLKIDENTDIYDRYRDVYMWFTFPYTVDLKITKYLQCSHTIYIDCYDYFMIITKKSNYQAKDLYLIISLNDKLYEFYDEISISPLNEFRQRNDIRYDIVNKLLRIDNNDNEILRTKPDEEYITSTPKPLDITNDDDNLGIIVIIVCCVGGVLVIAGIVTAVICVRKKKKSKQASSSEADEV